MRSASKGDAAEYEWLLRDIAAVLRITVRRRLSAYGLNPQEAEDVVQEVLLGIHQKRATWDESRPITPWVHAIARYKTVDATRRLGRTRRLQVDLPFEDWVEGFADPDSPDSTRRLDAETLLATLPERQRRLVQALTVEGATVRNVAERFSMTEGAVRVALHRGLKRLSRLANAAEDETGLETGR